jgi:hypothetical protein
LVLSRNLVAATILASGCWLWGIPSPYGWTRIGVMTAASSGSNVSSMMRASNARSQIESARGGAFAP